MTILKIEHLAVSLKDKRNILQRIDDEILNLMDANDVKKEVLTCEDLRSEVQEIVIEFKSKWDKLMLKSNNMKFPLTLKALLLVSGHLYLKIQQIIKITIAKISRRP